MLHIYADGTSIYDPLNNALYLISPKLKLEWGKAGALDFAMPPTHLLYDRIQQLKTVVTVELDGAEIFRGRVLSIERDFNNTKTVSCEGDLAYLVDSVQKAEKYEGTTHDLFRRIVEKHNQRVEAYKRFAVGEITIDNRSVVLTGQSDGEQAEELDTDDFDYKQIAIDSMADNWSNTYDYIVNCLIDYCGGYLRTRRVGNTTYLDLLESARTTATQEIRFGENLLDLTEEISSEDLFTVLVPLGDENLTIAEVNGGSDELVDSAAVQLYGRIVKTNVFQNVTSPYTLLENARRYLAENANIPTTITVKAIDLTLAGNNNVSAIRVGDRVHINSSPHRLVEYLTCTEIEYDFTNPENNSYTFGNPKQTLTQRYREDKREQSDLYGGIGGISASGIGASSLAVAETAKKTTEGLREKIFKEWIDIDPDNPDGIGSLGALYQLYSKDKKILENEVGIKFDASSGNISLYSLSERITENTKKVEKAQSDFEASTSVINGKLTAIASMQASYKTETDEKIGLLEVRANEFGSAIIGKADKVEIEAQKQLYRGLSEDIDKYKRKLKTEVGIDLDAETGNLNLYSMSERINDNTTRIEKAKADFTASTQVIDGRLTSIASMQASYKTETDEKIGSLELRANELGTTLTAKVDNIDFQAEKQRFQGFTEQFDAYKRKLRNDVGIDLDATTGNVNVSALSTKVDTNEKLISQNSAKITTTATELGSQVNIVAQGLSRTDANVAQIQVKQTNLETSITLKADKTLIESELTTIKGRLEVTEADITTLKAKTITADEIVAKLAEVDVVKVKALAAGSTVIKDGSIKIGYGQKDSVLTEGGVETKLNNIGKIGAPGTIHYHKVTVNDDGTITLGSATNTAQSFKIADTKAYRDGVSAATAAVTIDELDRDEHFEDTYNSETHVTTVHLQAVASNGKTKGANITVSGSKAFKAGQDDVTIAELDRDEHFEDSYNSNTHVTTVHLQALASNGKTKGANITVSGAKAYKSGYDDGAEAAAADAFAEGAASVDITSVARRVVTGYGTERYNTVDHTTTIFGVATASNGKTKEFDFTTGTQAYNAGVTNGENGVTIDSLERYSDDYYSSYYHKTYIYAKTTTSNGKTKYTTFTTDTTAYDSGLAAGAGNVTISSLERSQNDYYNSTTHKTIVYAKATASNGQTKSVQFFTDTTAYDTGFGNVTVSIPADNITFAESVASKKLTVTAKATASNGKTSYGYKTYDTSVYFSPSQYSVTLSPASDNPSSSDYQYYNANISIYNSKWQLLDSITRKINNSTMYNRGYAAGYSAGSDVIVEEEVVEEDTISSISRYKNDYYNTISHDTTVYIQATMSNGTYKREQFWVSGDSAYAAGQAAGGGGSYDEGYKVGYNEGYDAGYHQGESNVSVSWSDGSYDIWLVGKQMTGSKITSVKVNVRLTNGRTITSGWIGTGI